VWEGKKVKVWGRIVLDNKRVVSGVFGEQKVGTHFNYSCLTAGPALLHVVSLSLNLSLSLSLSLSRLHMLFLKQTLRRIYHKFFFAQPWGKYEIFQLPDDVVVVVVVIVWNWNWFA